MPAMATTNNLVVHYDGTPLHINHFLVVVKVRTVKTEATVFEAVRPSINQSDIIAILLPLRHCTWSFDIVL